MTDIAKRCPQRQQRRQRRQTDCAGLGLQKQSKDMTNDGHRWSPDRTRACYLLLALSNGIRTKLCYSESFCESFNDHQ